MSLHPLDRPAWSALHGRQAQFALWRNSAVRFSRGIGMFVAAPDWTTTWCPSMTSVLTE